MAPVVLCNVVAGLFCLVALTSANIFSDKLHDLENKVHKVGHSVEDDIKSTTREIAERLVPDIGQFVNEDTGCQCVDYNCGCCLYLQVPDIHLDDTACVNVTYYPDQYGIGLIVTIDDYSIINMTLSAKNPPPVCAGIPFLEEAASICIDFYDLDVSNTTFSGCVKMEVRLYHVLVKDFDMGCFNMPLKNHPSPPDLSYMGASRLRVV